MKKVFIIVMLVLASVSTTIAENYERQCINRDYVELNIQDITDGQEFDYCKGIYDSIIVHGRTGFDNEWNVNGQFFFTESITLKEEEATYDLFNISHTAGGQTTNFGFGFWDNHVPYPFSEPLIWKRQGESITLHADSYGYSIYWSTGDENTEDIEISQPGIYTVTINDTEFAGCVVNETFSVEVWDNVELYRATVDLETNLNKVTWQTNESQAEYISQVKVYRDGFFVGTAPCENGYFLDAIGSNNAARNYQIVGVSTEGTECPISSYQKGTIHTTYYLDVNDNLNMTWNIPYVDEGAQGTLTYFQVCKYDPVTEQLTVVDQVNSLITDYTCSVNQFEGGYPVIAAVFSDAKHRDFEDLSFSNMYTDIAIQPQEITISMEPGWTWFSYPYAVSKTLDEALVGFMPMSGDIIVSQSGGTTSFVNGRWRGALTQFTPGLGYMYYSSRSESAPLVFDLSSSRARVKP